MGGVFVVMYIQKDCILNNDSKSFVFCHILEYDEGSMKEESENEQHSYEKFVLL